MDGRALASFLIASLLLGTAARAQVSDPEFHPAVAQASSSPGSILGEGEPLLAFGHLSRNVNLKLPPARNNLVPYVALEYRSNSRESFLGQGWQIPIDTVYRSRRFGTPEYLPIAQPNLETVSLEYRIGGDAGQLVYVSSNGDRHLYRPKRDTRFTKFYYDEAADTWIVHTRDGLRRELSVADADPSARTHVQAWYVKTIDDPLGNRICYEYDYGAQSCDPTHKTFHRLQFIEYNGRENQTVTRLNRVQFHWGVSTQANASYSKGWRSELDDERLDKITVYGYDELGNWDTVDYEITWSPETHGAQWSISQIQVRLSDGETLPATTYDYEPGTIGFPSTSVIPDSTSAPQQPSSPYWDDATYGDDQYNLELSHIEVAGVQKIRSGLVKLIDWDGDGDLDQLVLRTAKTFPNLGDTESHWFVRVNDGQQLGALTALTHVPAQVDGTALEQTRLSDAERITVKRIMDMNGDNRPDIVEGGYHPYDPAYETKIYVYLARTDGTGWESGQPWFPGFASGDETILRGFVRTGDQFTPHILTYSDLIDINGDGYTDYLFVEDVSQSYARVYLGSATGISQSSLDDGSGNGVPWPACDNGDTCIRMQKVVDDIPTYIEETRNELRDVNGDGVPDWVTKDTSTDTLYVVYGRGDAIYVNRPAVELGQGDISRIEDTVKEVRGLYDMDGDGLLDYVEGPSTLCGSDPHYVVWLNKGTEVGWRNATQTCWMLPADHATCGNRYGADYFMRAWDSSSAKDLWKDYPADDRHSAVMNALIDLNGDGFIEWVRAAKDVFGVEWKGKQGKAAPVGDTVLHNTPWCSFRGTMQQPGLIKKISSETGVDEEFSFGAVPYHAPFAVQGIKSVIRRDHNVNSPFDQYQVLYEYEGTGSYSSSLREIHGFSAVKETQAGERVIEHQYHQGEFTFGAEHTTTVSDVVNPYPWLTIYTAWDVADLVDPQSALEPRKWLRPGWINRKYFDPQSGVEQARRDRMFVYEGDVPENYETRNLGLLKRIEYQGAEGSRYDELTHKYINNAASWMVRAKSITRTTSPGGTAEARTEYRYDDECSGGGSDLTRGLVCDMTVYRGVGAVDAVWSYAYDPTWGTLTSITDPVNTQTSLTWHPEHIAPSSVTVDGKTTELSQIHFLTGQPQQRCGPQHDTTFACWKEELDGWGRIKKLHVPIHDPVGFYTVPVAELSYSPQGGDPLSPPSVAVTLYPDGPDTPLHKQQQRKWYFNGKGQVTMAEYSLFEAGWGQIYREHDKIGRLIRVWNPYESPSTGPNQAAMSLPPTYEYNYDYLNRLVETKAEQQITGQLTFGVNTATATDAVGAQTEYTFSSYGEITKVVVDKNQQELRHDLEYNPLGLLTKVKRGLTDEYTYDYYADGTLYQATLGSGNPYTYTRSPGGRLANVASPTNAQVAFSYDGMGRVSGRQTISGSGLCPDPSSDRSDTLVYDEQTWNIGRLTSEHLGTQYSKQYDYDGQGLLSRKTLTYGSDQLKVQYKTNLLGQLVEKKYGTDVTVDLTIGFELTNDGLPHVIKYNGADIGYLDYDTDLQVLHSVGDLSNIGPSVATTYDRWFLYDGRRRLVGMEGSVNGVAWDMLVTPYNNDNLAEFTDNLRNETYNFFYDDKSRIEEAYGYSANGVGQYSFSYNDDGTLDVVTMPGTSEHYEYGQDGRLERITDGTNPLWNYTWDADGQMCIREQVGQQRSELFWSADGMLTQIGAAERSERFVYDAAGNKIAHVDTMGNRTLYLDGAERHLTPDETVFPFGMPYVRCEARDGSAALGQCFWYDHMNVALVTDSGTGSQAAVSHYSPFGQKYVSYGQSPRFGFNGKEEVGVGGELLNYGFRHYDPSARVFLSPEPLAMAGMPPGLTTGMDAYSYAAQNPTTLMDILGLQPEGGPPDAGVPDAAFSSGPSDAPSSIGMVDSPLDAGAIGHPANMALPPGVTSSDVSFRTCEGGAKQCAVVEGFHNKEAAFHWSYAKYPVYGVGAYLAARSGVAGLAAVARLAPWAVAAMPAFRQGCATCGGPGGTDGFNLARRALTVADLGAKGVINELRGTVEVAKGVATVRIDMIAGKITNPMQIVGNLTGLARQHGANVLRIEAVLGNQRLYDILVRRYGLVTQGNVDVITIPIK